MRDTVYRNQRLLRLARHVEYCMHCGAYRPLGIVACHSNAQKRGKGMGLKAHDIPAYLCEDCHDLVDRRTGEMPMAERELIFLEAAWKSWLWLMQEGYLVIREAV